MTLPFTALRRLDCVPEPTKPAALAKYSCVDQALYPLVAGSKKDEKLLYMKREKFNSTDRRTFTILVDREPSRAGIDPYNKLIDRISDDNTIDVTK